MPFWKREKKSEVEESDIKKYSESTKKLLKKYGDEDVTSLVYLSIGGLDNKKTPEDKELYILLFGTKEQVKSQDLSLEVVGEVRDYFRSKYIVKSGKSEDDAKRIFPPLE